MLRLNIICVANVVVTDTVFEISNNYANLTIMQGVFSQLVWQSNSEDSFGRGFPTQSAQLHADLKQGKNLSQFPAELLIIITSHLCQLLF